MPNFTPRDRWMLNLGLSISGAVMGALIHSLFLMIWNMVWVGVSFYAIGKLEEGDEQDH